MNTHKRYQVLASICMAAVAYGTAHAQQISRLRDYGPNVSVGRVAANSLPGVALPLGLFLSVQRSTAFIDLQGSAQNDSLVDPAPLSNARFTQDTSGRFYRSGSKMVGNSSVWSVRGSEDGGLTWTTIMADWQWVSGKSASALGIASDGDGTLFVCGEGYDGKGRRPIIRRSTNQGMTWQTYVLSQASDNFSTASDIEFVPPGLTHSGGIFAVGRVANNWTVWRWIAANDGWDVVRSWSPPRGMAEASAITSDQAGRIYVAGSAAPAKSTKNWSVWRSDDAGANWIDLGNNLPPATQNLVYDLAADALGNNLWVVGSSLSIIDATRTTAAVRTDSWTMQRWMPTGGWDSAYSFFVTGTSSRAVGVTIDGSTGACYVSGMLAGEDGQVNGTLLQVPNP